MRCPTCEGKRWIYTGELVTFDWDATGSPRKTKETRACPQCLPHIEGPFRLTWGACWSCNEYTQLTTDELHMCLSCRSVTEAERIKA
jgi:hypothetical protein